MNNHQSKLFAKMKHLLDSLTPAERAAIDVHQLLAERREIAMTWCLDDVLWLRPDLTKEEAWDVLEHCRDGHDGELGITWTFLRDTAACLYRQPRLGPPATNQEDA